MEERTPKKSSKEYEVLGIVFVESKITKVRSIRASFEFWEKAQKVANQEKTDINKLIVKATNEYCDRRDKNEKQ